MRVKVYWNTIQQEVYNGRRLKSGKVFKEVCYKIPEVISSILGQKYFFFMITANSKKQ